MDEDEIIQAETELLDKLARVRRSNALATTALQEAETAQRRLDLLKRAREQEQNLRKTREELQALVPNRDKEATSDCEDVPAAKETKTSAGLAKAFAGSFGCRWESRAS
jgi:ParB-like chromosome segregation protein Spo0J